MVSTREDRDRLHRARSIVVGGRPPSTWRSAGYAVYVAVLIAVVNAFPLAQAITRLLDLNALGSFMATTTARIGVGAAAVLVALGAWRAGRVHGPVMPDLSYVDLIVDSPIDRATTTRPWWRLSLLGSVVVGLLMGAVISGSLVFIGHAPLWVALAGSLIGAIAGWAIAWAWLLGQARDSGEGPRGRPRPLRPSRALAVLSVVGLRRQAASSVAVGGAALIGDVRAARLAVASPTTRGRDRLLRAASPLAVIARRDWLGLQRNPSRLATGAVAVLGGSFLLSLRAGGLEVPMVATIVGAIAAQSGLRAWCEGLRLQGDNAGTPPLLGIPPRHEALAHLLVPTALYAGCVAIAGGTAYLTLGVSAVAGLWPLALTGVLLGVALVGAFRGLAPMPIFQPDLGVPALIAWSSAPGVTALIAMAILTERARTALAGAAGAGSNTLLLTMTATLLMLSWGLGRQQRQTDAHRG